MFDDGGNWDDYDDTHNDYVMVDQIWVSFLANFRTSVGDLQPPTYDYWGERYSYSLGLPSDDRSAHKTMALAYIIAIWFVWFLQIFVMIILMLNFLIAIVNDSYQWVVDNDVVQSTVAKATLNEEQFQVWFFLSQFHKPIYSLVIASAAVDAGDANNDGFTTVTRTIRREVGRTLGEVRGL